MPRTGPTVARDGPLAVAAVALLTAAITTVPSARAQEPPRARMEEQPSPRPPTFTYPEIQSRLPPTLDAAETTGSVTGTATARTAARRGPGGAERGGWIGAGRATFYEHAGRTASGERFDPDGLTAAHPSLPLGTRVRVVNARNGRAAVVRITDRTSAKTQAKRPHAIDLSRGSARAVQIDDVGTVALYRAD